MLNRFLIFLVFLMGTNVSANAADVTEYLPANHVYDESIAKPEDLFSFGLGERHIRHDQLLRYFEVLSQSSDRVLLTEMGMTNEMRRQLLVTISHPNNLTNIDDILANNNKPQSATSRQPLVIWLGYSVHGDEISGSNASLAVAYHLVASQDEQVLKMLEDTIIVLEPSINPDGMDRFTTWVNTHRGVAPNSDPNHIEHHQDWRTGRTNHFGFDLNRDWLLLSQRETQNRMAFFHQYQPHVLGDFHEMGANSTYFFQPGIPSRTHPFTPEDNQMLTRKLATYHAKALDSDNRLYYSQESFDDFYYGKGSTYPDINGGVGVLFEQASSRGFQQDTINGLLSFEYGIKNQVLTSFSTIEGAWKNKAEFFAYREKFDKESLAQASKEKFEGYLLASDQDQYRMQMFLKKLKQHQINVYPLSEDFRLNGRVYPANTSYYVPLEQKKYRVIKALFDQGTNFRDNTFYDVSGWTLPLAMNIEFHEVSRTWGLKLAESVWQQPRDISQSIDTAAYAYVFEWFDYRAPRLLNALLSEGVKAKVATKSFTSQVQGKQRLFPAGSIMIPAASQQNEGWRALIENYANIHQITVHSVSTGLTIAGIDLGSSAFAPIDPVKVLLIGGKGSSQYEAADILFYLDAQLHIPVTVVEQNRLRRVKLADYSHIIMVDGNYKQLGKKVVEDIKTWVQQGGVIFGQKRAAKWLADAEFLKAEFVSKEHLDELFDVSNLSYQDKEALSARKRIAGAIFQGQLDTSHPLSFGYSNTNLPLFRNSTLIMKAPEQPFISVARYAKEPLLSGYTDKNLVNKIASNAAIVAHNFGRGRVIATTDVLAFRGYWAGSSKLLANSLFFAKAFSASGG
ncbi:M14 family zinc carboxypeptidase [Thalassotalea fusca]